MEPKPTVCPTCGSELTSTPYNCTFCRETPLRPKLEGPVFTWIAPNATSTLFRLNPLGLIGAFFGILSESANGRKNREKALFYASSSCGVFAASTILLSAFGLYVSNKLGQY